MTKEECLAIGGHCWVESNIVMDSLPPTYSRSCKHCGLVQWGQPQPSIDWRDR